jgi:hypothetical protein
MSLQLECCGGLLLLRDVAPAEERQYRFGKLCLRRRYILSPSRSPRAIRDAYQQHEQDEREFRVRTCHAGRTPEQNDLGAKCRSDNLIRMGVDYIDAFISFCLSFLSVFFVQITVTPFLLTETGDLS